MFLQVIDFDEERVTKSSHVDFRIKLGELSPTEVTDRLGIQPSRAWAKNEQYVGKMREPETGKIVQCLRNRPWGMWIVTTTNAVHVKRVESHLQYLVDLLEPAQEQIKHYLECCEPNSISFYIHWEPFDGHGSYVLPCALLSRLAKLSHFVEYQFDFNESATEETGL